VKAILNLYFSPKSFEKNRKLYRLLGVHIFKKFLPTGGDYVVRYAKIRMIPDSSAEALEAYERCTRVYETIHVIFFFLYIFLPSSFLSNLLLNLVINVYPIMTQRYNRARIDCILKKRMKYNL
jgi:hypothetical protein